MTAVGLTAFKPKTHIWIGQQVLNDVLPDGKITIDPLGEFAVPQRVVDALRAHPKEYLMGLVGPDGFPDPIVGQTTVHPGEPIRNDEWLQFLVDHQADPASTAFAFGFLGHAASDIAAHTWVNLYAGDYFELKDGQEEEVRHVAIEDYVARATPPLRGPDGNNLGAYRDSIDVPTEFVRRVLLAEAVGHYRSIPSAQHIVAMVDIRRTVSDALEAVKQFNGLVRSTYLAPNEAIIKAAEDAIQEAINLNDRLLQEKARVERRLTDIAGEIGTVQKDIDGIVADIEKRANSAIRDACVVSGCAAAGVVGCAVPDVKKGIEDGCNALFNTLNAALDQKNRVLNQLRDEQTKLSQRLAALPAEISDAKRKLETATANEALAQARKVRQLVVAFLQSADPLEFVLQQWVSDIDKAMSAYVNTGAEVSKRLVDGSGSLLDPYKEWLQCSAPAFMGTPSALAAQAGCAAKNLLGEFTKAYEKLRNELGSAIWLIDPVGQAKREALKAIQPEIDKAVDQAKNQVLGMLSPEFAAALRLLEEGADPEKLATIFASDESGKGLLRIPDVAQRLDADMRRNGEGVFDSSGFNAVFNAVVLAKLSLLDRDGVHEVMKRLGAGDPGVSSTNILTGFAKSIDGNHQWQRLGLPYLRTDGYFPKEDFREFGYGVGRNGDDDGKGFPLWKSATARPVVFSKVLHGPVAPAIENSCPKQFPDLVHPTYPFRACAANPFPDSLTPSTCRPELVVDSVTVTNIDPNTVEFVVVEAKVKNTGGIATAGFIRSEVFEKQAASPGTAPSGSKPRSPASKPLAFADRSRTEVVCDGEGVLVRQPVIIRTRLTPGQYSLKLTLSTDRNGTVGTSQIDVPDAFVVAKCLAEHRVRRGDTLESIAKRYGVSAFRISARNRITDLDEIKAGATLCIPQEL